MSIDDIERCSNTTDMFYNSSINEFNRKGIEMSNKKYNGWTNQATWKVAVRCNYLRDVLSIKEYLEELDIAEPPFYIEGVDGFINEVVRFFYDDVNWYELENADWPEDE